jgi:hypothetical protein
MVLQAVVFFSFTVLLHYQVLPESVVRYFQVLLFNFFYRHLKICRFPHFFFMNVYLFCFDLLSENTTSTTTPGRWRCCSWTWARWADRWWVNWWTSLTTTYKSETVSLLSIGQNTKCNLLSFSWKRYTAEVKSQPRIGCLSAWRRASVSAYLESMVLANLQPSK